MGGILATGAAAAAGAYLGNSMAGGGHNDQPGQNLGGPGNTPSQLDPNTTAAAGLGGAGLGGAAGSTGFPALDGVNSAEEANPDYFSDLPNNPEPDYFSADDTSSYDDSASDDIGGGGFDDDNNNSDSW